MELSAKIDIRIEGDSKNGYFIEYKIGDSEWRRKNYLVYYLVLPPNKRFCWGLER